MLRPDRLQPSEAFPPLHSGNFSLRQKRRSKTTSAATRLSPIFSVSRLFFLFTFSSTIVSKSRRQPNELLRSETDSCFWFCELMIDNNVTDPDGPPSEAGEDVSMSYILIQYMSNTKRERQRVNRHFPLSLSGNFTPLSDRPQARRDFLQ